VSELRAGAATGSGGSTDPATPASGPRRLLVAVYAIFALAATARAVVQLATKFDDAPLAYLLSLFSGLVYLAATVGLVTDKPWSRPLAWTAVSVELAGVLIVGTLSVIDSAAFPHDSVWSKYGSGYVWIPLVLPVIGLFYLWRTRPQAR
jgi:hypothetical protein